MEKMKWRRHERGGKESENKEKKEERKMVVKEERTTKIMPFEKKSAEQRQPEISCGWGQGNESRNSGVTCRAGLIPLSAASANFCSWSSGFLFSFKEPLIEEISSLSGGGGRGGGWNQVNQISSFSI